MAIDQLQSQITAMEGKSRDEAQANESQLFELKLLMEQTTQNKAKVQAEVDKLKENLNQLEIEKNYLNKSHLETDQVKADLLEQIEEYQEEVNSHKQSLQRLKDEHVAEIEVLKDHLISFQQAEEDFVS